MRHHVAQIAAVLLCMAVGVLIGAEFGWLEIRSGPFALGLWGVVTFCSLYLAFHELSRGRRG